MFCSPRGHPLQHVLQSLSAIPCFFLVPHKAGVICHGFFQALGKQIACIKHHIQLSRHQGNLSAVFKGDESSIPALQSLSRAGRSERSFPSPGRGSLCLFKSVLRAAVLCIVAMAEISHSNNLFQRRLKRDSAHAQKCCTCSGSSLQRPFQRDRHKDQAEIRYWYFFPLLGGVTFLFHRSRCTALCLFSGALQSETTLAWLLLTESKFPGTEGSS